MSLGYIVLHGCVWWKLVLNSGWPKFRVIAQNSWFLMGLVTKLTLHKKNHRILQAEWTIYLKRFCISHSHPISTTFAFWLWYASLVKLLWGAATLVSGLCCSSAPPPPRLICGTFQTQLTYWQCSFLSFDDRQCTDPFLHSILSHIKRSSLYLSLSSLSFTVSHSRFILYLSSNRPLYLPSEVFVVIVLLSFPDALPIEYPPLPLSLRSSYPIKNKVQYHPCMRVGHLF